MGVLSDWSESNAEPISPAEIRGLVNDQRFPLSEEPVSPEPVIQTDVSQAEESGSDLSGNGGIVDEFNPLPE